MGNTVIDETTPAGSELESTVPLKPMISYAQNFEDVMLRRALQDIERGVYIDLGAFHPDVDSVTCWFYSQGWTGVNVEPNPTFFQMLRDQRPHDINLRLAVTDAPGTVRLQLLDGLSTIIDEISQRHLEGNSSVGSVADVEAVTLDHIFTNYAGDRTVDFLKVDVEGAEAAVLNACAFQACRPRVLLIEATEPNSTRSSAGAWEPQLLSKGYIYAYFDGLNRFYVREEDSWRAELLRVPPNVFDHFILPLADSRVDLAGAFQNLNPAMPVGGVPGLLAQRDDLAVQLERAKAQVAELSSQLETHVARCVSMDAHIAQMQTELTSFGADRVRLQAELASSSIDCVRLQTELGSSASVRARTEAELASVNADRARLQSELMSVSIDRARVEAELAAVQTDRDRLVVEAAQLNLRCRTLLGKQDELRAEVDKERRTVAAIRASRSWRVTAPVRRLSAMIGLARPGRVVD